MPLLSIILPVFNGGKYLRDAIASILSQTFKDFELIILNDGSTDSSLEIIRSLASQDPRIVVVNRENRGLVATLNEGIALAKAAYIARMDADDIALQDRLIQQIQYMADHPQVVALGTGYTLIDEDENLIKSFRPESENNKLQSLALERSTPICHPTAIFVKSAFCSVGGYREHAYLAEDLDLWLRLGEIGEIRNLPEVHLYYRQHGASISESKQEKQLQIMDTVVREAYQRRNLKVPDSLQTPLKPWRSTGTAQDDFLQILRYGWWAWSDGNIKTSRIYASRAVKTCFWSKESWKLLYCSWFRPSFGNR